MQHLFYGQRHRWSPWQGAGSEGPWEPRPRSLGPKGVLGRHLLATRHMAAGPRQVGPQEAKGTRLYFLIFIFAFFSFILFSLKYS